MLLRHNELMSIHPGMLPQEPLARKHSKNSTSCLLVWNNKSCLLVWNSKKIDIPALYVYVYVHAKYGTYVDHHVITWLIKVHV